jgi:hypothetical protein
MLIAILRSGDIFRKQVDTIDEDNPENLEVN